MVSIGRGLAYSRSGAPSRFAGATRYKHARPTKSAATGRPVKVEGLRTMGGWGLPHLRPSFREFRALTLCAPRCDRERLSPRIEIPDTQEHQDDPVDHQPVFLIPRDGRVRAGPTSVERGPRKRVSGAGSFSPYANRNFPTEVFWGDTHVHTGMSMDAGAFGARLMPDDAYRFAAGAEVTSSTGLKAKLSPTPMPGSSRSTPQKRMTPRETSRPPSATSGLRTPRGIICIAS